MVIDCVTRRSDRLQRGIAQLLAIIDLVGVGGLEQQAANLKHLHEQAVASLDRMIIDMAGVREVLACRLLARGGHGIARQGR
jgi:hypothetical protein